jgi:hypothetical protein
VRCARAPDAVSRRTTASDCRWACAICLPSIVHVAGSGNRLGALEKHGKVLRLGLDGNPMNLSESAVICTARHAVPELFDLEFGGPHEVLGRRTH